VTIAVVPIKDLESAKVRLMNRLTSSERRALVLAMLNDVLSALSQATGLSGIMVVTREREVAARAAGFGAELLEDRASQGHTAAIELAARELERRGEPAMLCVPGDVPRLRPEEIAAVLCALEPAPSVVFVPSRDGRGTNAALVAPPRGFSLRFGEPSFEPHVARAKELGLRTAVVRLPGLGLDLDTPHDLDVFLQEPSATETYRFLRQRSAT